MIRDEIIGNLAKEGRVEQIVANVAHSELTPDLFDLAQEIYMILLTYDEDKIVELWAHDELGFFIARIAMNQYRSPRSPFHYVYRKFSKKSVDITGRDFKDEEG